MFGSLVPRKTNVNRSALFGRTRSTNTVTTEGDELDTSLKRDSFDCTEKQLETFKDNQSEDRRRRSLSCIMEKDSKAPSIELLKGKKKMQTLFK